MEEFGRNREVLERNRRTRFRRLVGIAGVAAPRAYPLQNPVSSGNRGGRMDVQTSPAPGPQPRSLIHMRAARAR